VILYSDNGGKSWSQASVPVSMTLTCIAFATPKIGWAAGHFGAVLKTVDGGKTWQLQINGIQVNQLVLEAAQAPPAQGDASPALPLALPRATRFVNEGPDKPFLTLLAISPQEVMAFGAYRMAVKSNDGGATWMDISLHIYDRYSHNIYDAIRICGVIDLVGETGLVFRSDDGGDNFLPLTSPSNITLFGIVAANDGGIIVFGVAGTCFRSVDGGKSWTQSILSTEDDLTVGRVLSSGAILVASETGVLYRSTDNGITFRVLPAVRSAPIFDMEETEDGAMVMVGPSGPRLISAQMLHM
jgi:photosystem II stability/assembly factor-like uncharacterized protein